MIHKKILIISLIIAIASSLGGCKKDDLEKRLKEKEVPIVRTINGITYEQNSDSLVQITEDTDKKVKFGVISDVHGFYQNVEAFAEYFKGIGVDGIIMLGDYAQHFRAKPNPRLSDYDEISHTIESAAKTGLPVYVIPGNHETRKDYNKAVAKLRQSYNNIFDLSNIRTVDGDDFDLVSNPYGTDFTYNNGSFKATAGQIGQISDYARRLKNDDDPEILVTHQPPKGKGRDSIDVIYNGENVGDAELDRIARDNGLIVLAGHIHEAGARGETPNGTPIRADIPTNYLRFNPGSASPWKYLNGESYKATAGVVFIEGDSVKYHVIKLQ